LNRDSNNEAVRAQQRKEDPKLAFLDSLTERAISSVPKGSKLPINMRNANGESVLFFALQEEKFASIALQIVNQGADVTTTNLKFLVTPMMLAAGNSTPDVVRAIIGKSKEVNTQSADGSTALIYAVSADKIDNVQLLSTRK
jgi:ankyrin repeat protein